MSIAFSQTASQILEEQSVYVVLKLYGNLMEKIMKRLAIFIASSVVLLGSVALRSDAAPRTVVQNISFDGFCDGMALNIDRKNTPNPNTFVVYGNATGCLSQPVGGSQGSVGGSGGTITATTAYSGSAVDLVYLIRKDRTWCNYPITPTTVAQLNCGTWTPGTPPVAAKRLSPSAGRR